MLYKTDPKLPGSTNRIMYIDEYLTPGVFTGQTENIPEESPVKADVSCDLKFFVRTDPFNTISAGPITSKGGFVQLNAFIFVLGFHADGILDSGNNNMTSVSRSYIYNDSRTAVKFSKLSHAGPIVMGIGGFIIVATCVLTFEARDSAAKVGPAAYSGGRTSTAMYSSAYRARSRSLDVRSVASQTMGEMSNSSNAALHIFDKKALMETFKKFSRTIRTGSTSTEDQFHRSPSAPSLLAVDGQGQSSASTSRRALVLPKTKRAAPSLKHLRQTMSVDYTTSPFMVPGTSAGASKSSLLNVSGRAGASTSGHSSSQTQMSENEGRSHTRLTASHSSQSGGLSCPRGRYGRGSSTASAENYSGACLNGDEEMPKASRTRLSASSAEIPHNSRRVSLPFGQTHYPGHRSMNLNVHFQPTTVESHLPFVVVTPNTAPGSSIEALTCSSTSLRVISPLPNQRSEDSSFDRISVKSDRSCGGRSPMPGGRPRLRTELSCRPTLMRQSGIDHSEIISVTDSDDEFILEEEPEIEV
ncbi:unnamed protein product [Allacma fusca]|uniref:Uncharacterized protein n=2 Tax=Allacma fusca TaxID=39272 RepID=A0A8J2L856_9HEXA|nr:unnamed protein product [Allacma fusca]